jgi:tetratricopeptide (TPR) repeat protein
MRDLPIPEASRIGLIDAALAALDRFDVSEACRRTSEWCAAARSVLADAPWWLFRGRVDDLAELAARLFEEGQEQLACDFLLASAHFFTHAGRRPVQRVRPVLAGHPAAVLDFVSQSGGLGVDLEAFGVQRGTLGDSVLRLLDGSRATPERVFRALGELDDHERLVLLTGGLRRWPGSPVLWRVAGGAFLAAGRHREAMAAYERALARDPGVAPGREWADDDVLFEALRGLPRIPLDDQEPPIELDVQFRPAEGLDRARVSRSPLVNLAVLYRHLDGPAPARAVVERFLPTAPWVDVGRAWFEVGEVDRGVQWVLDHLESANLQGFEEAVRMLLAAGRPTEGLGLIWTLASGHGAPEDWLPSLQGTTGAGPHPAFIRRVLGGSLGTWADTIEPVDPATVSRTAVNELLRDHAAADEDASEAHRLIDDLGNPSDGVRSAVIEALERLGPGVSSVVAEQRGNATPVVQAALDALLSTWAWDAAARRVRSRFRVASLSRENTVPFSARAPQSTANELLDRALDAVRRLEVHRATEIAEELCRDLGRSANLVPFQAPAVLDLAEALARDGRTDLVHRLLVLAAPRLYWRHDPRIPARCRALLSDTPPAALEFLLRTGDHPWLAMVGLTPDTAVDACETLLATGRVALGDLTQLMESLERRPRVRLLQSALRYFPNSSALAAILALSLLDAKQYRLAEWLLEWCLEVRLARRSGPLDAQATADEAWWACRPNRPPCPVLIEEGIDEDGAVVLRRADPPQGLARAQRHQPVLQILAIIRQDRGASAAAETIKRFEDLEHPSAVLSAYREIGRLDLALDYIERRVATATPRPWPDFLGALAEAYLHAGRHMDALLVARVFLGAGRAARTALETLLYGGPGEIFEEFDHADPFGGEPRCPRVDEAVADRQVLELMKEGAAAPPAELAARAASLASALRGSDRKAAMDALQQLNELGPGAAAALTNLDQFGDATVRERVADLLVRWGWQVAEERFRSRFGVTIDAGD